MSGAPKRLHEEGGHQIPSKRPLEENSVLSSFSGKLVQPVATEYRLPIEPNPDGRMTKIQRIDPREVDKRLSVLPIYRIPSPVNGSCLDHSSHSENRPELRDQKDGRDAKVDTRETKAEVRETRSETRVDPQSSKLENDARQENRVDGKELRADRETCIDLKPEKLEKDGSSAATPHLNWKETKETHKSIRYSESPGEGLDPWHVARHGLHNSTEGGKEISTAEGRESLDTSEAVGENKIELKGEEKIREKERKRKDEKYRDWGERDKDRHDRHYNLHLVNSSKDLSREDRDAERWDRERKDFQKEKDIKDRERDLIKKTSSNLNERDILRNERDPMDISTKMPEKDHTILELKKPKELDSWKVGDRENKEKKRDKDQDPEIERHDRRNKGVYDKEPDDGYAEGDGATERDRDTFSYSVQQRKRMLRPRGISQGSHREPRFRSRSRENEGSQEKSEVSSIVYKVGECMQEFLKSWKEYESTQDGKKDGSLQGGPVLEIRIPAEHVTASNRQVKGGQLWGTDIYSDDSDLVAVLMHTGYCRPTSLPPPALIQELRATIRVLPPQDSYTSTLRNNVRSRAWGAGISCSFRVERCCIVKKGGGTIDLEPRLTHISAVEPTLAPVSVERTMTTRSAASNALRQQRFIREVTIQYNLCNEPWLKYSINVVADKGLKKPQYTSARLKKGEVLYLETHMNRFELCFTGEKLICNGTAASPESVLEKSTHHNSHFYTGDRNHDHNNIKDVFRWSRCKKALPQRVMRSIGIPSPIEHVEVLEENLDWEDLQWSQTGVVVAGKEYTLARVHFVSQS